MARKTPPSEQTPLAHLLAADIFDVAAKLFVASFRPGGKSPYPFRNVRNDLAAMTGVKGTGIIGGVNGPEYLVAVECALLWERALLAARTWSGDNASMYVHLLRRGEVVRDSADPEAAARAAIGNMVLPAHLG